MRVSVIGAGSWGSAVAWLLDSKGYDVLMWAREPEIAEAITKEHHNSEYLIDVYFSDRVSATSIIKEALVDVDAIVMVTPSVGVRATAESMKDMVGVGTAGEEIPIIILSKGVECGTSYLMTDILEEVLGNPRRLAALSGPNHAEEVSRGLPGATTVASADPQTAEFFAELFGTDLFRVYTNDDLIGVELCGAGKNVVAIACGVADGLEMGDNTKAALMTRGLAEMARLGEAMGANPMTYMGLAGMGDLIVTCTSKHSRNRALGEEIAHGGSLEAFEERTHMVAEGALACRSINELAHQKGIDMPLTEAVYSMLYEDADLAQVMAILMARPQRSE
ncbi:MAG: NAD(P)-dependent glycerol-3-phosphate dehydrogenase [Coriobacteriia bacterium]|nr:NAD(P)-dependent glycerol-3-phosphate dehydrogenase [Coriobacteriia bacterium]